MTSLGIGTANLPKGEAEIRLRGGWFRSLAIRFGGAGVVGLAAALIALAQRQPNQVFDLLKGWGWVWILVLAAMIFVWDLAKIGLGYLGTLAQGVKETAVAMNRIADKDDRERDRMITETAFVGQRLVRMSEQHDEWKDEQREHNRRVVDMISQLVKDKPQT